MTNMISSFTTYGQVVGQQYVGKCYSLENIVSGLISDVWSFKLSWFELTAGDQRKDGQRKAPPPGGGGLLPSPGQNDKNDYLSSPVSEKVELSCGSLGEKRSPAPGDKTKWSPSLTQNGVNPRTTRSLSNRLNKMVFESDTGRCKPPNHSLTLL